MNAATETAKAGKDTIDALTIQDLKTAPTPPMCSHPTSRLKNGSAHFGVHTTEEGEMSGPIDGSNWLGSAVFGDIVPGGSDGEAAAVIVCHFGGVPWADHVVTYRRGESRLWVVADLDLYTVTPDVAARVTDIRFVDGVVRLTWDDRNYGRSVALQNEDRVEFTADYRHTGDGFELLNLEKRTLE